MDFDSDDSVKDPDYQIGSPKTKSNILKLSGRKRKLIDDQQPVIFCYFTI